jgi:ABC-type transport system involved in multi-copper enzyme maturation permease subunit
MRNITGFLRPAGLIGPILGKELRVTARRKRSYLVRSLYLLLMMMVIVLPWLEMTRYSYRAGAAYQAAQMSQTAITLTMILTWLQFITAQMLAIVFLSGAISDEIYHKTLGVLMTTPITGLQIVLGKLFSRMLSLMILLALSLPVLGLIRLMGGVPWDYVIGSFCITLTAAIFAGTLSLFISIFQKRAYSVIIQTILALIILYLGIPVLIAWLSDWTLFMNSQLNQKYLIVLSYLNPFVAFSMNQSLVMSVGFKAPLIWPWHSLIVLSESVILLLIAAKIVRKVALLQITGQIDQSVFAGLRKAKKQKDKPANTAKLRTVRGHPVVWKETREPWLQGRKKLSTIITAIIITVTLFSSYAVGIKEQYLDEDYTHVVYGMILFLIGVVEMIMLSATMITTEREARSWPILLATPLTDGQIVFGKAVGVIRKSLPAWFLLIFHILIFIIVGYIHPAAALHMAMIVTGVGMFVIGAGLFFSGFCKRTTSAVIANVMLAVTLWLFIPIFMGLTGDSDLVQIIFSFHPIAHAGIALAGGGGAENAAKAFGLLRYDWPEDNWGSFAATTAVIGFTSLVYAGVGLFFYKSAKDNLREKVFE